MAKKNLVCQLAIVGAGSAGCAAALAAVRLGLQVILVEQYDRIGGMATFGGVNCWEPVAGATGIPQRLFNKMKDQSPGEIGIYRISRHCLLSSGDPEPYPGGEQRIDPSARYGDTLRSYAEMEIRESLKLRRGIIFEPELFCRTVEDTLKDSGCCQILSGAEVVSADCRNGMLRRLELKDGTGLKAELWIDCCGFVSALCGCRMLFGREAASQFGEPDAPLLPSPELNGVSRIFRISPTGTGSVEKLPAGIPEKCWWAPHFPVMVATEYPNGDFNCNMLPTMNGLDFYRLGTAAALNETERRVRSYWHYLQTAYPEFRYFYLKELFPRLGCRDGYRVLCRRMLTESCITGGLNQQNQDEIIALCDHSPDFHGTTKKVERRAALYGIPYGALIPVGMKNLLTAGRCAGFTALAASSCRLSRTMMSLGEAAANAAYLSYTQKKHFHEISPGAVRELLCSGGVRL